MDTSVKSYVPAFLTGDIVEIVDKSHKMVGWTGVVTSFRMWQKPMYKSIPFDHYRIEMDSGDGKFYGDYATVQLKLINRRKSTFA